jgi:hypothetical protein
MGKELAPPVAAQSYEAEILGSVPFGGDEVVVDLIDDCVNQARARDKGGTSVTGIRKLPPNSGPFRRVESRK